MTFFDFLSSLVITRSILDLTFPVTQLLQGPATGIADATHLIESMKILICCKRNTVYTFHKKCYSDIVELACKVLRSANQEHRSCKGTVIIFYQNRFLIISKK